VLPVLEVAPPDLISVQKQDAAEEGFEKPYRIGIEVPVTLDMEKVGQWVVLPEGGKIWRLKINCAGAQALGLNYRELHLPTGSDLFVYTPDQQHVIGAYSSAEIPLNHTFATRPLPGSQLVIEYYEPVPTDSKAILSISGLVYIYRGFDELGSTKSTSSSSCEVNVNCAEGNNWQNQKQGVVKIMTKVGGSYLYCSGTLLNNTAQDFSSLFLTAAHCSKDNNSSASADDYNYWVFYFNYEYPGCTPSSSPNHSITGALKLAIADNPSDIGSDFLLLRLLGDIPGSYYPYYCGWDKVDEVPSSGVCMHHPGGDVKKISTYSSQASSTTWGGTPGTHWSVSWVATANGHGVTEGGSSGSALFNQDGLVIGTLTGGPSSCQNPTDADLFGKVAYSWESNGTDSAHQLKPWLDPLNIGTSKMAGTFNETKAIADFTANVQIIPIGGMINFQDLSAGKPITWHWYFTGGTPAESTDQNPSSIQFGSAGKHDVKLVVTNVHNTDSLIKKAFVDVRSAISPNPSSGHINILTDVNNSSNVTVDIYNMLGQQVQEISFLNPVPASIGVDLPTEGNMFIVKIKQGDWQQTNKVLVLH